MFGSLLNLAADVVTAPIAVAQDVVTLGGVVNGRDESYTESKVRKVCGDVKDVVEEIAPQ